MPTPLPTLASSTDLRAPAATPHRSAKPSASEPSFSETLNEKRSSAIDDPVAGPAPPDAAADASPTRSDDSEAGLKQAVNEKPNTGQPTDAVAQETRVNAQGLSQMLLLGSTPTDLPTGVVTDSLQTDGQAGHTGQASQAEPGPGPADPLPATVASESLSISSSPPTPGTPTPGSSVVDPALQSDLIQPQQQRVASPTVHDQAQPQQQSVAPPAVQDQPQLQQNPTSEATSVVRIVDDGQTPTSGTGRDPQSGDTDDRTAAHRGQRATPSPATGRAIDVQAGVAVQNATGHAPLPAPAGPATGGSITNSATPDLRAETAPNTSATIVRGLTAMLNQRGGVMTMRLEPPALGQLRVQMTVARGVVTAQFQPATIEAQALLERSLATLRLALESQGLSVERLTVHAAPASAASREAAEDQSHQQQQQASRHQPDAGEGRSRGRGDGSPRDGRQDRRPTTHFAEAFETLSESLAHTGAKAA